MIKVENIEYGSMNYKKTLDLRNKVMRIPLGLNIYDEDFSFEKNAIIVGAYEEEELIGVGTMSYSDNTVLWEVGANSNTSIEAKLSAKYMARIIAEHFKE